MFRGKKNLNNNEVLAKKISSNVVSNESSTEDGSNQKTNIYQLKQKTSPNIVILNNKLLSSHIPSVNSSGTRNFDFKNDVLIKEIIGNENLLNENQNQFRSLFNLDDSKKFDMDLKYDINNKHILTSNNSSLMSKNNLKTKIFNNSKEASLDEYIKGNIIKKFKRKKSLNINKLKIFNNEFNYNNYNTPKNNSKNRVKNITLNSNEKDINNSGYNYPIFNLFNNNNNDKNQKEKNSSNNSISKLIFKNNSNLTKKELKEMKEKKIEKIIQLMNNSPSLNVNKLRNEKNDCLSILSNFSNRNKKVFTLQNNLNFNDIVYSNYKKPKKKLFLRINTYKKEKTDYYDNNDIEDNNNIINRVIDGYKNDSLFLDINNIDTNSKLKEGKIRSLTKTNFRRKNQNNFNDLNISTENTSNEKNNIAKTTSKKKMRHISLDSSHMVLSCNRKNDNVYENIKYNNLSKEKNDGKNYKILLDNIQKRMSYLISNLINYIELLKKDK